MWLLKDCNERYFVEFVGYHTCVELATTAYANDAFEFQDVRMARRACDIARFVDVLSDWRIVKVRT